MNEERIFTILSEVLEKGEDELRRFPRNTSLNELGLASIQFIQFIVAFEEAFDVEVRDSDLLLSNFETLEKLFSTLKKYIDTPSAVKKVLICDCDNVLWHGIAGEEELYIDEGSLSFQQELIRLYNNGVLLCLCSRNEEENIGEAFGKLNMLVRKDHFICSRINRQDKASNIWEIAEELNLSLDSFVFVDDSDYEIGLIQALLPEVETVKSECDDLCFIEKLKDLFGQQTSQDINRTKLYREQKEREKIKGQFTTVEEYNHSLGTKCNCTIATQEQAERIAELSQRTNQCNLSTKRYTKEEIEFYLSCDEYRVISLDVTDLYGDMGIVGASVVRFAERQAIIEGFFLSCRAFDRGFEVILLNETKKICCKKELSGIYRPTDKNHRYQYFYSQNGVDLYE